MKKLLKKIKDALFVKGDDGDAIGFIEFGVSTLALAVQVFAISIPFVLCIVVPIIMS